MAGINLSPAIEPITVVPGYAVAFSFQIRDKTGAAPYPLLPLTGANVRCIISNRQGVVKSTLTVGSGIELTESDDPDDSSVTDGVAEIVIPGSVTLQIRECKELIYMVEATMINDLPQPYTSGIIQPTPKLL